MGKSHHGGLPLPKPPHLPVLFLRLTFFQWSHVYFATCSALCVGDLVVALIELNGLPL